ncbi:MAG: ribonuclease P protein component [Flavobacteriaceae bacterium]
MKYTFKAYERLKSKKKIQELFTSGRVIKSFPFKLVYTPLDQGQEEHQIQLAVSVSKRLFKNAVDRNRQKRLIKEAYRLQKPALYLELKNSYACMIIYLSKEELSFDQSQKAMKKLLTKFIKHTNEEI